MNWNTIINNVNTFKIEFDKSYKCINKSVTPTNATLNKHLEILIKNYNSIRAVLNSCYSHLNIKHKKEEHKIFSELRDRLIKVFGRYSLNIKVPLSLSEQLHYNLSADSESESDIESHGSVENLVKMPLTPIEFLNFATKIIPDYDGKPENLQRFLDAIALAETQSEDNVNTLIHLIKTKLVGSSRNAINNENTIAEIINSLKSKVKYESTDVITAKIMNVKQHNKSANQFTKEIEELTKSLENSYIKDGVSSTLAEKYST